MEVLRSFGVLDTAPEPAFDDLTALAAQVCGTPMAFISLVDAARTWTKSSFGAGSVATDRAVSFCVHLLGTNAVMVVPDTHDDPRFRDNPSVTGEPFIRFYAGAPLTTDDGHTLGSLCVVDGVPRLLDDVQLDQLRILARQVMHQLSQRRRAAVLTGEVASLRSTVDQTPVALAELDLDGSIIEGNQALADLLEVPPEELTGARITSYSSPDERPLAEQRMVAMAGGVRAERVVRHLVTARGTHRWVTGGGQRFTPEDGSPDRIVSYMVDSTVEHLSHLQLTASNARFTALVEYSADAIIVLGHPGGVVLYASPGLETILGIPPSAALGLRAREFLHPSDFPRTTEIISALVGRPGEVISLECRLRHVDGHWRNTEITASNRINDPAVGGVVVNLRDITERVEAADHLAHQAMHDTLTDLPNRALIIDRLEQALARARRSGNPCAVLFIDLDRFKQINDILGHRAGDELLKVVAGRLRQQIRQGDSVARLGGDEFVVLAENLDDPASALAIAERIRAAIAVPAELTDRSVTVGCSIGIALSHQHAPETLIQEADMALYRAKQSGRNRWEVYDQAMRLQALRRLETEDLLRGAIENDLLALHYQPIIDLTSDCLVGTEALARIRRTDGSLVQPGDFIAVAEDSGLIVPVGAAVLQLACAQQASWRATSAEHRHVAVNVSARQLASENFVGHVTGTLHANGLPPEALCIEITESTLIDVGSSAQHRLHELKACGVTLALDDFGTGWASLGYLRRFPIDIVKIDRGFVAGLGTSVEDTELVKAVVGLGQALGLTTVAEGVETEVQDRMVHELGCDQAQGYFYGRPVPAD